MFFSSYLVKQERLTSTAQVYYSTVAAPATSVTAVVAPIITALPTPVTSHHVSMPPTTADITIGSTTEETTFPHIAALPTPDASPSATAAIVASIEAQHDNFIPSMAVLSAHAASSATALSTTISAPVINPPMAVVRPRKASATVVASSATTDAEDLATQAALQGYFNDDGPATLQSHSTSALSQFSTSSAYASAMEFYNTTEMPQYDSNYPYQLSHNASSSIQSSSMFMANSAVSDVIQAQQQHTWPVAGPSSISISPQGYMAEAQLSSSLSMDETWNPFTLQTTDVGEYDAIHTTYSES